MVQSIKAVLFAAFSVLFVLLVSDLVSGLQTVSVTLVSIVGGAQ